MWITLREMRILEHLKSLLHSLYKDQVATVRMEHGETDTFTIGKEVRQGCILSLLLFNQYAENVMRQAGLDEAEEGVRIGGRRINNLRYADDTKLLASTEDHLQTLIRKVGTASGKAGPELNLMKTKIMSTTHM